ncbi:hypothetical protein IC582_024966 [Cucumis melo]|uniref:Uncharacterized protein LOC103497342 n=2 Tax=Cucumis melo TaxID=3656 RepID=A0A1S3C646_CUCME|nr:uncharacterized protein LOC103497342 [Cucumis melo]KAA0045747.1 uncharacterized protein E6C27_scaffold243G002670 [Cucumis melo var. makuwa]TYJ99535.1 uncharacterized protein E5676_scaffold123G001030 [Cucumis melo var. makuwa]
MSFFTGGGRFRELLKKYGKVAIGVHFSVSGASITGLYVAIKNNVDVESLLDKLHMDRFFSKDQPQTNPSEVSSSVDDGFINEERSASEIQPTRNRTAELAASTGGALALAVLCNKALLPIRIPITIALTPPIARLLARRGIVRSG